MQAAPWLRFLWEPESSSSCCVSAGDVTARQRDVHFSYDRLQHPQLLVRPKPAALLLGNFMGSLWGKEALYGHAVLEESQCRALLPWIIQHSLEQSLVAICKALLLAVGGWVLLALTPAPCACAHTGCEGTVRSVISNSNKTVNLIQSWVQTSEKLQNPDLAPESIP